MISARDSYVIVAQAVPPVTARLVDRWQELEQAQATQPNIQDLLDSPAMLRDMLPCCPDNAVPMRTSVTTLRAAT